MILSKANEYQLGPGYCAKYNTGTTAYVTHTFAYPVVGTHNVLGDGWMRTTLVDYGNGTFECYLNDGVGNFDSGLLTATLSATSISALRVGNSSTNTQVADFEYLPGTGTPTAAQAHQWVAGIYCGFNAAANCNNWEEAGSTWTANAYTSFDQQFAENWNTHLFYGGDPFLRDTPFYGSSNGTTYSASVPYTNGGTGGTYSYNGSFSQSHAVVSTNAPEIKIAWANGGPSGGNNTSAQAGAGVTCHIDGVLASSQDAESGAQPLNYFTCELPNDGAFHTVDFAMGAVFGDSAGGYTAANLYTALGGNFLYSVSIPNNQQYTMASVAQTGTTTLVYADSVLSGVYAYPFSSSDSVVPMMRWGTSPLTNNFALLGFGSILLDTEFHAAAITSAAGGSGYPNTAASTYVTTFVAPLATGGTASNITTAIMDRGINDFNHLSGIYGAGSNCIGIIASDIKNWIAAHHAYYASMVLYVPSPVNSSSYGAEVSDGCTGDSYTTSTTLNAYEYTGGAWTLTSVPSGTVFSGSSKLQVLRIVEQDLCLTLGTCTYVEMGPGAPGVTVGSFTYYTPDLSSELQNCTVNTGGSVSYAIGDKVYPTQTNAYGGYCVVTVAGTSPTMVAGQPGRNYTTGTNLATTTNGSGVGLTVNTTVIANPLYYTDSLHLLALGHYAWFQYWSALYNNAGLPGKIYN